MNLKRVSLIVIAILMVFSVSTSLFTPFSIATDDNTEGYSLVTLQSTWRYLDDGTDPAGSGERTSWTAVDFDDSSWKVSSGDATFGAKKGELAALDTAGVYLPKILLNHYQADGTCVPTYFFRTSFELSALPEDGLALKGSLLYDDAAIVYINGTRVAAFDEPTNGFDTNLSYGGSGAYDPLAVTFIANANLLKVGENVVSVELHQQRSDSSDIYFEMTDLSVVDGVQEYVTMNVGSDETQRNFTWYFPSEEGEVQYAVRNGNDFPAEYTTVKSNATEHDSTYIHRATITGLKPETEYVYRIANGSVVSDNYYFETDGTDSFNFFFVGDPQIGASWGQKDDAGNWSATLSLAKDMFPETSLLVSAGDQVETCTSEINYQGFLAPETLSSLAIATTVGNHDALAPLYSEHFNNPNTILNGRPYGTTEAGGDYWYTYNNTLFIHLNANSYSMADHKAFMQAAIAANPDVTWKITVLHFAMFGAGPYYNETVIADRRVLYAPLFAELGIDVVLAGHEHVYARSYMMNDVFTPDNENGAQSVVTNPSGILYITGSSSSGSKYYDLLDDASTPHIAVKEKNVTTFSNVEITSNSFKITTYRVEDKSVLDTFEIVKTPLSENKEYNISVTNEPLIDTEWNTDYSALLTDGIASDKFYENDGSWFAFNKGYNTDGDIGTFTVDLGDVYDIDLVRLHLANVSNMLVGAPESIKIYGSQDNKTFYHLSDAEINTDDDAIYWSEAGVTPSATKKTSARYIKIEFTLDGDWAYVNEIEVYGNTAPVMPEGPEANLASTKDYTVSVTNTPLVDTTWNTDYSALLTDGEANASFNAGDGTWFAFRNGYNAVSGLGTVTVDFENICEITKLRVHLANSVNGMGVNPPSSVKVYGSVNGIDYNLIGEMPIDTADDIVYWSNLEVDGVSAGSVRFEFALDGSWAYVNEIEVHGTETETAYVPQEPVEDESSVPEEESSEPIEDESSTPVEDESSAPAEDESSEPVEDESSEPVEDETSEPVEDESSEPVEDESGEPDDVSDDSSDDSSEDSSDDNSDDSSEPGNTDEEPEEKNLGDINGNGEIDSLDYILLKRAFFNTYKLDEEQSKIGDINQNGEIDSLDYILLKRAYFGTYKIK